MAGTRPSAGSYRGRHARQPVDLDSLLLPVVWLAHADAHNHPLRSPPLLDLYLSRQVSRFQGFRMRIALTHSGLPKSLQP